MDYATWRATPPQRRPMRKPSGHIPCPNDHPDTGRACQRPRHHAGAHQCCYPGGADRWAGDAGRWNPTPELRALIEPPTTDAESEHG